jgi:hypothetical protein
MRKFKEILKDKQVKKEAVKKLPSFKTVDFRTPKKIDEKVHGDSDYYGLDSSRYSKREVTGLELEKHHVLEDHGGHIGHYTIESHHLNSHLFENKGKHEHYYDKMVSHLDKHLSSHAAHKDFHVYSGLYDKPEAGTYQHHGYMSSSLHPHIAGGYSRSAAKDPKAGNHILKIHIPKGSKHGAYIARHSEFPDEREFLLGRGKKFKIHPEPEKHGETHIWHAHIVD